MKITYTLFAIAVAAVGFTTNANAQGAISEPALVEATLVQPIAIGKIADMNFGTLASSITEGTATVNYDGSVDPANGVSTVAGGETPTAAKFTVTGEGTQGFTITYPPTITLSSGANTLSLALTCQEGATSSLLTGTKELVFQGVLTIPASSVAGTYANNADFLVTVEYN